MSVQPPLTNSDSGRTDTITANGTRTGLSRRAVLGGGIGASVLAQDDTTDENGEDDATEENGGEGDTTTVELVNYAYEPGTESPHAIPPGTTVQFVWITDSHNIVVDSQPDDADWDGLEPIEDTGFEYEHTFEVPGTYEFHCDPHLSLGMEGAISVEEGATTGDGGGGSGGPLVPENALTLAVGTIAALVFVTFMAYFLVKYGSEYED